VGVGDVDRCAAAGSKSFRLCPLPALQCSPAWGLGTVGSGCAFDPAGAKPTRRQGDVA